MSETCILLSAAHKLSGSQCPTFPLFILQNLINSCFNLRQYFFHCKNQFDYSMFGDPVLQFFKLFHSYLIAFRQTLEGTQDPTSSHIWKTSALLTGHKEMQPFHFAPN